MGTQGERDTLEIALAADYPLNRYIDLIAEVVNTSRTGSTASTGTEVTPGAGSSGSGSEIEETIGFAWHTRVF